MIAVIRRFFEKHPYLREALLWSLPAIAVGIFLRILLFQIQPYAYFGADSKSYYGFTYELLENGRFSLYDKRRYLYLLFCLPVTLLPGATLTWLAWIQTAMGLATLVPLAYAVRRSFQHWKWLVVPVTLLYAGLPFVIWFEHELLAEALFFDAFVWALAGWIAWISQVNPERRFQLWWWFFIPLSAFILTKPSSKFFFPGLLVAFLLARFWRVMNPRRWIALAAVILLTGTMGQDSQGSWLLYSTAFPLTRMDTPLHKEYKEEIRDMVHRAQDAIGYFYSQGEESYEFLQSPSKFKDYPLWSALDKQPKLRDQIYKDLSKEGILHAPHLFFYIGLQKLAASGCFADFSESRFQADYQVGRLREPYEQWAVKKPAMPHLLFALPKNQPLPPYDEFSKRLGGDPHSFAARFLPAYVRWYHQTFGLVTIPGTIPEEQRTLGKFHLEPLGWLVLVGTVVTACIRRYRLTLGLWILIGLSYVLTVYLIGPKNPRYLAPLWPLFLMLAAAPLDALLSLFCKAPANSES